jgi:23S rRNA (adenine2503-C2)-methyltransferase
VNVIPFDPWSGGTFETSSNSVIDRFAEFIRDSGFSSPVRGPRGRDILAACGQLRTGSRRVSSVE